MQRRVWVLFFSIDSIAYMRVPLCIYSFFANSKEKRFLVEPAQSGRCPTFNVLVYYYNFTINCTLEALATLLQRKLLNYLQFVRVHLFSVLFLFWSRKIMLSDCQDWLTLIACLCTSPLHFPCTSTLPPRGLDTKVEWGRIKKWRRPREGDFFLKNQTYDQKQACEAGRPSSAAYANGMYAHMQGGTARNLT